MAKKRPFRRRSVCVCLCMPAVGACSAQRRSVGRVPTDHERVETEDDGRNADGDINTNTATIHNKTTIMTST